MNNLQRETAKVKSYFSDEELRQIWTRRRDDQLFFNVGRFAVGVVEARRMPFHLVAWSGFEQLLQIDVEGMKR